MARRILIAMLIVFAAACLNVAVAWGAVCLRYHGVVGVQQSQTWSPPPGMPSDDVRGYWEEEFGPAAYVTEIVQSDPTASVSYSATGMNLYRLSVDRHDGWGCSSISMFDEMRQAPTSMEVLLAGWPMSALRCERVISSKKYQVKHAWMVFAHNGTRAGGMILPCRPMWTGTIVNVLFYAMMLFMLRFAWITGRRARLRKRGRCVGCGYDLRATTSSVCPECGRRSVSPHDQSPAA